MQLQIEYTGFNSTHESVKWRESVESFLKDFGIKYFIQVVNLLGTEEKHIYYPNNTFINVNARTIQDLLSIAVEYNATILVKPNGVITIQFK